MDTTTDAPMQWPGIEPNLNDALSALPAADRDIVLRRYVDGFSLREIAVTANDGTLDMESNNPVITCAIEREALEFLIGANISSTERLLIKPELVIKMDGVTTYASGYGIYPVKDAEGKVQETIQLSPRG